MFNFKFMPQRFVLSLVTVLLIVAFGGALVMLGVSLTYETGEADSAIHALSGAICISISLLLIAMGLVVLAENKMRRRQGHTEFLAPNRISTWIEKKYWFSQVVSITYFAIGVCFLTWTVSRL